MGSVIATDNLPKPTLSKEQTDEHFHGLRPPMMLYPTSPYMRFKKLYIKDHPVANAMEVKEAWARVKNCNSAFRDGQNDDSGGFLQLLQYKTKVGSQQKEALLEIQTYNNTLTIFSTAFDRVAKDHLIHLLRARQLKPLKDAITKIEDLPDWAPYVPKTYLPMLKLAKDLVEELENAGDQEVVNMMKLHLGLRRG